MPDGPRVPGSDGARPTPGAPSARALLARIPRDWSEAAWVTAIVRLGLLALGVVVLLQGSVPGPCHFEVARNGWATIPPLASGGLDLSLVGIWQRWDACWYGKIAAFGYEAGTDATAFFPAYPLLVRAAALPLGGHVALAGMLANLALTVVALAGLHRLVSRDLGARVADRTILYLSIFPAAIFLHAPFTEALFLAAVAWAFVGAREGRWWLAAGAALVAGLTRAQGILLVLPLAWEAMAAWRASRVGSRPSGLPWSVVTRAAGGARPSSLVAPAIAVAAPVAGFAAFAWYTSAVVGLPLFDAQDAWGGREFHPPWETVAAALDWVVSGSQSNGVELLNVASLLLFAGITLLAIRRLPASYSLYAAASILLIAIRIQPIPLTSTTRLLLVVFPVFAALGIAGRHRRFDLAWTVGSVLLLGFVAVTFVRGDFVA
jgi:hypothetical protein